MLKRCLLAIFYYCSFPVALASQSSRMVIEDQKDFYGIDSTIERFFTATPVPPVVYNDDPFMGRRRRSAVPASAPTLHSHTNNWAVLV
jgi:hypothetical protein